MKHFINLKDIPSALDLRKDNLRGKKKKTRKEKIYNTLEM